jgi:hypothetical protein
MKWPARVFLFLLTAIALSGCGNLQRQSRIFQTNQSAGITIDASQRAIYSVAKTDIGGRNWQAFCAEPSPDAISALAASFGLDLTVTGKALGVAAATQDATASIGLRTQTIQLLRDSMYRLCEGYASGALDETGFGRLQRRYQHVMLALLAIESLTGPVMAQQAAISGNTGASLGKGLGELSKVLGDSAGELAKAEKIAADAKTVESALSMQVQASTKAGSSPDSMADLKKQLEEAQKDLGNKQVAVAGKKRTYESIEKSIETSQRLLVSASTSAAFAPVQSVTGQSSQSVVVQVGHIVTMILQQDYTKDFCSDVLIAADGVVSAQRLETVAPICAVAFNLTDAQALKLQTDTTKLADEIRKRTPPPPPRSPAPN